MLSILDQKIIDFSKDCKYQISSKSAPPEQSFYIQVDSWTRWN
jgi:hypothetical protein